MQVVCGMSFLCETLDPSLCCEGEAAFLSVRPLFPCALNWYSVPSCANFPSSGLVEIMMVITWRSYFHVLWRLCLNNNLEEVTHYHWKEKPSRSFVVTGDGWVCKNAARDAFFPLLSWSVVRCLNGGGKNFRKNVVNARQKKWSFEFCNPLPGPKCEPAKKSVRAAASVCSPVNFFFLCNTRQHLCLTAIYCIGLMCFRGYC